MKQKVYFILFVWFLLLSLFLGFKLYEVIVQKQDNSQTVVNPKTDTTYSKKPFKPVPQYKFIQVPRFVIFFSEPEVKVDTVYITYWGCRVQSPVSVKVSEQSKVSTTYY